MLVKGENVLKKRDVISLLLWSTITVGLSACCYGRDDTCAKVCSETQSIVENDSVDSYHSEEEEVYYLDSVDAVVVDKDTNGIDSFEKMPEVKVFEAGEHVFMIRYRLLKGSYGLAYSINSASITVPDGYEVLDMENYNSQSVNHDNDQTYGVDVWYINNETVKVTPVYNEGFEAYDYSQPGVVVEQEVVEDNTLGK